MTSDQIEPRPGEDLQSFRLRLLEVRVGDLEKAIKAVERLRRDMAVGVLVLLVALALASPQVWGVVLGWIANARQAMSG